VLHPGWTAARVLREAGASEHTALHQAAREINRPGTQQALAELRTEYRAVVLQEMSVAEMARSVVGLARSAEHEQVRLSALTKLLDDCGIVERTDQQRILVTVQQQVIEVIAPIILDAIPRESVPAVRAALQAALRERQQECGGNHRHARLGIAAGLPTVAGADRLARP
jgi:hypothetical protein